MDISTLTVVPADRMIAINGEAHICEFNSQPGVHAIQWFGDHGQIEFAKGPAKPFFDTDILAPYITAWHAGRLAHLEAETKRLTDMHKNAVDLIHNTETSIEHMNLHIANQERVLSEMPPEDGSRESVKNNHALTQHHVAQAMAQHKQLLAQRQSYEENLTVVKEKEHQARAVVEKASAA